MADLSQIRPSLDQSAFPRPGISSGRGQRVLNIIVAQAARQDGFGAGFRPRDVFARHQPYPLEPEPQRLPMDRRDDLEADERQRKQRSQHRSRSQASAPAAEGGREQGTLAVGLQDAQFDAFSRRRDTETVAHRHLDEGRDVKKLVVLLAHSGLADLAWLHRKNVSVDVAKRVADLIDDQDQFASGAIAKVNRQRIEGVAEQPRVTQQQHPPAGWIDVTAQPRRSRSRNADVSFST
jgi:hypothetical protein